MIRTQLIEFDTGESYYVHREHAYNSQMKVAHSQVLVCPGCQRMWAKLKFLDERLCWPAAQFCDLCSDHDDWHPVPGSLLIEEGWGVIDDSLLARLPPELVKREFFLHLKAYSL